MSRPKLLFVSPRYLFPMDQGGKIRTGNILKELKGGAFEIILASPAPNDHLRQRLDIESVADRFVHWPERAVSRMRRLAALLEEIPVAAATDRSADGRRAIAQALTENPDVVIADFPHATVLLPQSVEAAKLVFTHNVEAEIFERHIPVSKGPWRLAWRDQARKMRSFERQALHWADTVIAVSERDAKALRRDYDLKSVETIDTGVDLDLFARRPWSEAPAITATNGTIVFAGTMSWRANIDGIEFLMEEVWPLVLTARPQARALIVGRDPPAWLVAKAADRRYDWEFPGFVDDIRPYVAAAHVYVIPLRVGSGTRIKAFEAMGLGRPIVSTTVGIEGLDIKDGEHFLEANDAPGFARAILSLLDDQARARSMTDSARELLESRFTWAHVGRQFEAICGHTLDRIRSARLKER